MAQTPIQDLHPEVLEAFFGKAPLESAQPHFPTRAALFQAYAQAQVASFGASTAKSDACDLCGNHDTPVAWLAVSWTGRIRWHKGRLALVIIFSPVLAALAISHLGAVLSAIFKNVQLDERLSFATVHPLCQRCRRSLRVRTLLHGIFRFFTLFLGIISTAAAAITGAIVLSALFRAFNMNHKDFHEILPYFLLSLVVALGIVGLSRLFTTRILLPPSVWRLVKRPFFYVGHDLRTEPSSPPPTLTPFKP
jgi:hypothetical protein